MFRSLAQKGSLPRYMGTPWDARTYDRSSEAQQDWASEVLARLAGVEPNATVLDVGCGTGRVTEALLALVPHGRVLAVDASSEMVEMVPDHDRLWERLASALRPGVLLEIQCGGDGNIEGVREVIESVAAEIAAHLDRLPRERARAFAEAVVAKLTLPLDYVRLNASAVRGGT